MNTKLHAICDSRSPPSPWRSFGAVEYATLEWIAWFNNRRLLEPIGNIPPAEAEAN
jgi:transposase InsO family protein